MFEESGGGTEMPLGKQRCKEPSINDILEETQEAIRKTDLLDKLANDLYDELRAASASHSMVKLIHELVGRLRIKRMELEYSANRLLAELEDSQ